jgi:hypothetical protein
MCLIVSGVVTQQQDTSTEQSTTFRSDGWSRMETATRTLGTGDCGLQQWALVVPEKRQHHFSRRCGRAELFVGYGELEWRHSLFALFVSCW